MPAAGYELITVDTWLLQRLAGDAVGVGDRVYADFAPRGAQFPLVIYQCQTPNDVMGVNGARIMTTGTWIVKAVTPANGFAGLTSIAAAIDARLHRQTYGTVDGGGQVLACVRERPFKLVEVEDGKRIYHLGAIFLIQVR
jgi:hypothetical protein